ncbi:ATP-dependent helicase HrpB [Sphingomonadales bacterium 56]|uniref:ATP-dependent helicase HrpB n=1 Tax=unclassified Sphingobium TaxID=2611147 RepID=UPI00191A4D02|nr:MULTISPECIES: ATP-dependent helicase HrpB [unclassified Sphingobium]MBY2928454.1 ATP-dependent helicase HrpB [Sphingomonadales bacterium 56]MBY2959698.1 ATP-dependent helicase HrpB [Sphingomonadales bacterium 58]CAD7337337.1 ATP-dependent RNA helicase HrpB [Sphingobium sp. S6]CAD7339521.1 ATP-dependent RNA helicase HrpB [Sphingobium sp. S8]
MSATLPIHDILPHLLSSLRDMNSAVLVAPPGAGKTTAVAPALLNEPWCTGQVLLLSPRRLAARAAAERIAELMGGVPGRVVGYATRMDSRQSAATRLLVLTEGIFVRRIQDDPELAGVSAVLFDEVHERSLDSDLGLALALDAQAALRPDLRIVPMSATLDGARFAALLDDAPVLESEGRIQPLELRHIGRAAEKRIEDEMAGAVRRALAEEADGDLLAFLPGVAEIERTAERLEGIGVELHRLHGSLDPAAQRAAIRPSREGKRKVILATSIAETSLTIDGVRIVIDSGLARRPRYDRAAGVTRLVTERASQAAATQRAGRAARQRPGVAYRLWEAAATAGMPPFDPPEILESDLSSLLLDCALWGVSDPASMRWLDPPPRPALDEARKRLTVLEALDEDGRITPHGKALARLPVEPRIGHMLVRAGELGLAEVAAEIAVLLGERGIGGQDVDLSQRRLRWRRESGKRADAAKAMARRWAKLVASGHKAAAGEHDAGLCLALAFPDRVAKRRSADGAEWASVGGRGFRLDPLSPLAREEWLAVGEVQGSAAGARILSAAPISETEVLQLFSARLTEHRTVRFRAATGGIEALRERRLGAVRLTSGSDDRPDPDAVVAALLDGVRQGGLDLLPWSDAARSLRMRAGFAGVEALADAALLATLDEWLSPLLAGKRRLSDIDRSQLSGVLEGIIGWDGKQQLDRLAPPAFQSPAGSSHEIDYAAEGGPRVELRVQALFGLATHPVVGSQRIPLVLSLTSPAGRPIQTTRDLPGFWAGSWSAVAKEMRGRYPRHPWPDDPAGAAATLRTKRADARSKS